jgi:hypothetical protein
MHVIFFVSFFSIYETLKTNGKKNKKLYSLDQTGSRVFYVCEDDEGTASVVSAKGVVEEEEGTILEEEEEEEEEEEGAGVSMYRRESTLVRHMGHLEV